MMLAGAIHIPLAFLVLSGFAARLVWLLARERAIGPVSARSASIVIPAQAGIHAN
jgi:hypothetical protein